MPIKLTLVQVGDKRSRWMRVAVGGEERRGRGEKQPSTKKTPGTVRTLSTASRVKVKVKQVA
ncbi:hypothetical protein CFAM422_007644 [Trichoderma lentiforme]|uniref:Uncharacterized protein n=1 Tax=Trichoderma lentiforme TaxID=1567552 RepID=A0A9P4XCV5_9HYPO|nr:hypothetical protein CFAM422_007644 [Trichoderma lentiforme]